MQCSYKVFVHVTNFHVCANDYCETCFKDSSKNCFELTSDMTEVDLAGA